MSSGDRPDGEPSRPSTDAERWRPWAVLVGIFLLNAGFVAYALAPAGIFPLFMAEHGIDKAAAGATITAVFATWALLQIPAGYVMDRADNRRLLAAGAGLFLAASFGGVVTTTFPAFMVSRLVAGAAVVFIFTASINILNRVLPDAHRALGVSIFITSPPLGVALALATGLWIAVPLGWRAAVLAYTVLALAGALIALAVLGRPVAPTEPMSDRQFLAALRNPAVLLVSLASFASYAIWSFLSTWMPTYGNEVVGIDLAAAGAASALVPLAGIVSRPTGGWLSDRMGGRVRPVVVASFLGTIVLLAALSLAPSALVFPILLALAGAAVNLAVGLYYVTVHALADAATQATSFSLLITFVQAGNLSAPVLGGWLIEELSWTAAFGVVGALAVLGLVAIVLVPVDGGRRMP